MTRYSGNFNPFEAIQATPYISMRNDLPFDLYMDVLSKGEERYQKGLQVESQIQSVKNNITPFGERGTARFNDIFNNVEEKLKSFSSQAGSYADPDILNAMTKYANTIGQEIKPFIEYENMRKIDQEIKFKEPNPVEVDLPQTDMFDDAGNPIPYRRNWQPGLDYASGMAKIMNIIEPDITKTIGDISGIGQDSPFMTISSTQKKELGDKVMQGASMYLDTHEGKQQVNVIATQYQKENGISREDALNLAKVEVTNDFIEKAKIKNSVLKDIDLRGNPLYKSGDDKTEVTSPFLTPFTTDSHSYSGIFPSVKDFNRTVVDGSSKGLMKESLGNALLQDPEIRQSYIDLVESLPESEREKYFKNGVIINTNNLENFINEIGKIASTQNKGNLKQSVQLHELLDIPVNEWIKEDADRANESYMKYLDLVEKYKQYKDLVSDKFSTVIETMNDDIAIIPFGHNFENKDASSSHTNMNKEFKRVINSAKVEGEPDLKVESIDGVYRYGTSVKFYGKDENGEDKIIDFDNTLSKDRMLNYFKNPAMDLASEWEGYKVVGNKVFYVDKSGKELSTELPDGLQVRTTMGENGRFVVALFDKNGKPVPVKYNTYDGATYQDFQNYIVNTYTIPYQDAHYILDEIYGDSSKIKFK